ncbi:hypothetical protein D3C81_2012650 [compost metagenome]
MAQCLEQLAYGLWGEHRGRLVHDQQAGILQQAADDLDPLSFADGQRVYMPARINRQSVAFGHRLDTSGQVGQIGFSRQGQSDVFQYGQGFEQ